jgi:prepilin-type N-terminal cleavage/methylation domain-containing protein
MTHLNERGVTLVELLVAIMLLAIALAGLASSYPLAMQAVTGGGYQTAATLLAQQCIELAKSMPATGFPSTVGCQQPAGLRRLHRTVTSAAARRRRRRPWTCWWPSTGSGPVNLVTNCRSEGSPCVPTSAISATNEASRWPSWR